MTGIHRKNVDLYTRSREVLDTIILALVTLKILLAKEFEWVRVSGFRVFASTSRISYASGFVRPTAFRDSESAQPKTLGFELPDGARKGEQRKLSETHNGSKHPKRSQEQLLRYYC